MYAPKRNTPYVVIVPETGKEKTVWESRSMAATLFVFTKDSKGKWRVLANQRGKGCPDYVGYWVAPCGYLDYNENLKSAAQRECDEETGIAVSYNDIKLYKYNDSPTENRQNVTAIHYAIVDNGMAYHFSKSKNEKDEVESMGWMSIDDVKSVQWAFGHDKLIKEILQMRVALPWWKKIILNLYEKYLSSDSYLRILIKEK